MCHYKPQGAEVQRKEVMGGGVSQGREGDHRGKEAWRGYPVPSFSQLGLARCEVWGSFASPGALRP